MEKFFERNVSSVKNPRDMEQKGIIKEMHQVRLVNHNMNSKYKEQHGT